MSSSTSKPTLAFFGATGGCTAAAIVLALQNGYYCSALARTPSKLTSLMLSCSVPQSTLDDHLHIHQGDAKDVAAVLATLTPPFLATVSPGAPIVNMIISGIGTPPALSFNLDFTVCEALAKTMISALRSLSYRPDQAPYLVTMSTTGINDEGPRDVPILWLPIYHGLLRPPHKDKRAAEMAFDSVKDEGIFSGMTTVKPTLLTDGKETGHIRVGTQAKPAVGYTISRKDVGKWMYDEMVAGDGRSKWKGKKVSLTY